MFNTSHASIAYHKQLSLQWTVGTIGSVCKRAPLRRKLRGQHKHPRKSKRYEDEQSNKPNGARAALAWARGLQLEPAGFSLSPRALANWF